MKIFIGILILLLGLFAVYEGIRLDCRINLEESGVGFFPVLIGSCLIICSFIHLFWKPKQKVESFHFVIRPLVCFMFVGIVGYSAAMPILGYTLSTFIFVLVATKMLGNTSRLRAFTLASASAGVFLIVFKIWIQIPLPISWFEGALGVF